MQDEVFPCGVRGLFSLLSVGDVAGFPVRPQLIVPDDLSDVSKPVVVHIQRVNATVGAIDRVEEVRLTVYGFQPLQSQDIAEAIISYVTGDGVSSPPFEDVPSFYFDSIRQRVGPSAMDWPDQIFPVAMTLDIRARPISF
ncbi:hypothetical protein [Nesterenkonia suensis]